MSCILENNKKIISLQLILFFYFPGIFSKEHVWKDGKDMFDSRQCTWFLIR